MSDVQITKKANGRYEVRWRERSSRRGRTFDRQKDADRFATELRRRQQVAGVVRIDQGQRTLAEFVETYWRLHAIPNLTPHTRASYGSLWEKHLRPRLGDRRLREITPKTVLRLRSDLESAGVGTASVRKAMAVLQSILSFAVVEEEIEFNPAAPVKKPRYEREREPVIFLPADVELVRARFAHWPRDRALVSVLAYSGPRPEEALRLRWRDIGEEAIHYDGRKTRKPRWTHSFPTSPSTCASGRSRPAGRDPTRRCSQPTTAATRTTTTGAIGAGAPGNASRPPGRDPATCARATSQSRSTPASR